MSPEILTVIGMTATILIATWTMNRNLRAEFREEIQSMKEQIQVLINNQRGLNAFMAKVEALVSGLKQAIVARVATDAAIFT